MDTLESSIEKLLDSRPVYTEPMPSTDNGSFMQKMGKKLITEEEIQRNKALNDFGFNQNSINIDFIRAILELKKYCKKLEDTIEQNTKDFQRVSSAISVLKKELDSIRLRSTLNSNQIEKMDAGLYKYTEKLEDYILSISPASRNEGCPRGCIETDISDTIGYYDKIENAKKMSDTSELERFFHTAMNKSFSAVNVYDEVVIDFYGGDQYAVLLYNNLIRSSIYKIKLLKEGDMPHGHFSVICTDTAFVPRKLMLKSAIIIVTSDKPFEETTFEEVSNLKFLNDCGLHTYITLSETAKNEFIKKGFRCVTDISADKLVNADIIRIVEKAMETAVPSGAISLGTLREAIDDFDYYYLTDAGDIAEYNKNRCEVYPYDCLAAMEKAIVASIKNSYFPTGIVKSCRVGTAFEGTYSFVDGLNYVNHLAYENRKKIYEKVKTLMEPDGIFIMNGYDSVVGIKVRAIKGWNYYPSYEALWTREQIITELEENGFKIKFILPTGAGLFDTLPAKYKKAPAEWIIGVTI